MSIAAFDQARPGETIAKLSGIELLLRGKILDAASAIFSENDNGNRLERHGLRQFLRNERRSGSFTTDPSHDKANGSGVAPAHSNHCAFSSRFGSPSVRLARNTSATQP